MSNEQIITKVIEKAVRNGWKELEMWSNVFEVSCDDTDSLRNRVWITYERGDGEMIMLRDIIFSHDFAEAFFEHPEGYNKQEQELSRKFNMT